MVQTVWNHFEKVFAEGIKELVLSGEGFHAEFKISVPSKLKDLSAEVCAFANSAGGTSGPPRRDQRQTRQ